MTMYSDDIDLRPYLNHLVRYWWVIVLTAGLAAGVILALGLASPRAYQAAAHILITRSRSQLALTEQFPTVSEPVDQSARMKAIITIVESDSFTMDVKEELQALDGFRAMTASDLRKKVEVRSDGDLLVITATSTDAEGAASIANAWAEAAVKAINLAYYEGQPLTEVQAQLAQAKTLAAGSQAALEEFLQTNPAIGLQAELNAAQQALEVVSGIQVSELSHYISQKQALERLADQAQILKAQVEAGGESSAAQVGDALSVFLTRLQTINLEEPSSLAYGNQTTSGEASTANMNLLAQREAMVMNLGLDQVTEMVSSPEELAGDLEQISLLANAEAERAGERIRELSQASRSEEEQANLDQLIGKVQTLAAGVETANARENELVSQRDLDWATYQALLAKEAEIMNATSVTSYTSLASRAVAPSMPVSRSIVRNVLLAALLGAAASTVLLLGALWWNSPKQTAGTDSLAPLNRPSD